MNIKHLFQQIRVNLVSYIRGFTFSKFIRTKKFFPPGVLAIRTMYKKLRNRQK